MQAACRKPAAWMLCVLLAVGVFFSAWFLVRETRHTCTGDACPVCAGLQAAARRLKAGARPAAPTVAAPVLRRARPLEAGPVRTRPGTTLVDCKIRLDN